MISLLGCLFLAILRIGMLGKHGFWPLLLEVLSFSQIIVHNNVVRGQFKKKLINTESMLVFISAKDNSRVLKSCNTWELAHSLVVLTSNVAIILSFITQNDKKAFPQSVWLCDVVGLWVSNNSNSYTFTHQLGPLFFHHHGDPVDGRGIFLI